MFRINPHNQSQPPSPFFAESTQGKGKWSLPFVMKVKQPHPFSDEEVRAKSYQLWLKRGGGEGREQEDWQRAIKTLKWERSPLGRTQKLFQLAWSADNPKDAIEVIKTVISALGLVATIFAGVGLYLTYQNGQEERRLNTERLMTDRFAKAVEQLGSKESNVRIGAIYSLERIAKDSPKDHWTVMEVLTAFVRERSSTPKEWDNKLIEKKKELPLVSTDVQSVLTVIGRRNIRNDPYFGDENYPDLSNTNLRGGKFSYIHLQQIDLSGSNLQEVDFRNADLQRSDLSKTNLYEASLGSTNLKKVSFSQANLQRVFLAYNSNLEDVNLFDANLREALLVSLPRLQNAIFYETNLQGAILITTDLRNVAGLTKQQLEGKHPPLLCNVALPKEVRVDPDRDCNRIPQELVRRYPYWSVKDAKLYMDRQIEMKWK